MFELVFGSATFPSLYRFLYSAGDSSVVLEAHMPRFAALVLDIVKQHVNK